MYINTVILYPDPDQCNNNSQDHRTGTEKTCFGTKETSCPEVWSALIDLNKCCWLEITPADWEAKNIALKKIPTYMQCDGDGKFPCENITCCQENPCESNVEGAGKVGMWVLSMQECENCRGKQSCEQDCCPGFDNFPRKALRQIGEMITSAEQFFIKTNNQKEDQGNYDS